MIVASDIHLFICTWPMRIKILCECIKQIFWTFTRTYFSVIILRPCWSLIFFLYFPTKLIFSLDDEAWDFSSIIALVMFKSDDKFFWRAECSLLVCFWSFDEEIKLWVKACRRWISHWSSYESSSIRTSFMSIVLW